MIRSLFVLATLVLAVKAQAEVKIAVVDMQKAVQTSSDGKKAKAALEEEFNKKKKELEKKEAELRKMGEDLEKKKSVMSEAVIQKKQMELQEEMMKYRDVVGKSQQDMQKRQQDFMAPIGDKMKKVIDRITKEKGYNLVIERSAGIIKVSNELDITEEVIKEFDKEK